jgi:hypothetical protein
MDADHLLGGKRSPGVAEVGAHLAALTQPNGIRNKHFAYRTPGKGLDNRWNQRYRQLGHPRLFETGDHRVGPPAEGGRHQQVSQQQATPADQRQNPQARPHAGRDSIQIT